MSSRALRRLQREEEERKQLESLQSDQDNEAEEEEDEQEPTPAVKTQKNAFDFLNTAESDEEEEVGEATGDEHDDQTEPKSTQPEAEPSSSKKSKKKSKKKKKKTSKLATPEPEATEELDEIDRALKSLNTGSKSGGAAVTGADPGLKAFYEILSTDSRHLNPLNEMKKLFGSAVLEGSGENQGTRRRGRGTQQLDLGAALTGRHSQVSRGQGLAGLALRRNVFILGKEEWPKATSGGLGMEIVEEADDFTIEYRFVHNSMYQSAQRQFDLCVESMDPQRMIQHLQVHPYHISTLLQVSEIAKHQGDHAVGVDLLERALFSFGRSVHSSFATSMAQGKARLDFRRPENREFWLAAYRYIGTLGQRGTWRTAFEWAKLLLSLDPEQDPYGIRLVIDQLAVRGAQFETLVKLVETPTDLIDWGQELPTVQISLSMAYYKLKRLPEAQETLRKVAAQNPWILANLYKELAIEPVAQSIWGRQPRSSQEELLTVAYGLRAKDIWNTPEALAFLKSTLESLPRVDPPASSSGTEERELSMSACRHILISETPALMSVLPREITNLRTSSSDPLPPTDNLPSYNQSNQEPTADEWEEERQADQQEAAGLASWFHGILSRLGIPLTPGQAEADPAAVEAVANALEQSGMDINEIAYRTSRMEELQERHSIAVRRLQELEQNLQNVNNGDSNIGNQNLALAAAAAAAPTVERAPLQASVEEDIDEDAPDAANPSTTTTTTTQQPLLQPTSPPPEPEANPSDAYDDEANQRWLAGRGMLRLKDFVAAHGSDENAWKDDLDIDITPVTEYAHRITLLRGRASREFILNYALRQGAGAQAGDLIRRLLA